MAQLYTTPQTTLRLTRTFAAPREKVFRAWTDPEELKKWWGPPGYATPSAEVDLRAGGKYRLGMRKLPDGPVFYLAGTYQEVRAPERLVYTWRWEAEPEYGETLVTVEFHDRGGTTELILSHELFPNEKMRDEHGRGWGGCFGKLASVLANPIVNDLRAKFDAAWVNLTRQLQGMEPYMDRSDAPGQWTTRQVLAHLLGAPGRKRMDFLEKFSERDLPPGETTPGQATMIAEREKLTLAQFLEALDAERREVLAYLESLPEADLERRKARIPYFKQFLGTDEIALGQYVWLLFDAHWNDHAGQLAKIRRAVGLPEAK
jgi:uncharacterized protein YndB with AHSA1/START domain